LEHKTHQGEIHLLLLDCILHSPFFPKASVLLISNFVFGCKENSLSTFGFIMAWIRSKLAMTSSGFEWF
jgi:hypothetical protein